LFPTYSEGARPLGGVTPARRMFGKIGVFCDGVMLGRVTDNMLYRRVDDANRARPFEEARSSPPLDYAKGGSIIDLSFWRAPERLFDEPGELVAWARLALAAARRVASKRDGRSQREAVPACQMTPRGDHPAAKSWKLVAGGGLEPPTPAL
jgi:DNA transformation protein